MGIRCRLPGLLAVSVIASPGSDRCLPAAAAASPLLLLSSSQSHSDVTAAGTALPQRSMESFPEEELFEIDFN